MKKFLCLLSLLVSFSANSSECPVKFETDNYLEKVAELALNADNCYEASEIVNACALGASGDVYTVGAAINRCERDFPVMTPKDTETYLYLKNKCNEKYDGMDGTLYRSMNAFCHLSVTELFYSLLSREE